MADTTQAAGHPVLDWLIDDYKAAASGHRNSKGLDEVRRYLEIAALEPTEELARQRTTALEEEAASRYFAARRVKTPRWNLIGRIRAALTVRRLANELSAAHHADRYYWLVHRNLRQAARDRRREDLRTHTAHWDMDGHVLSCSCGDNGGFLSHIAALLSTDEHGARQALLVAHEITEVNQGMCGGCETCGSCSQGASCRICGDDEQPCLTYYVAAGNGPTESGQK